MSFASDVPVSLPAPLDAAGDPSLVSMFGFCMTRYGVRPELTASDHEHLSTMHRAAATGPMVWDDAHLEGR